KAQACGILASLKPTDNDPDTPVCSLDSFAAAPGFPSHVGATWHGNGCGSGGMSNVLAWVGLSGRHPSAYSNDMDFPLAQYPSVSFIPACNGHDACYTTLGVGTGYKGSCDSAFYSDLQGLCNGLTDTAATATCNMFASDYYFAVDEYGDDAFKVDQAVAQCAAWGNAMNKNGCDE
ncbi:MAG: hypothetical protein WBW92_04350, partial [Rhodanobacteraceae bacterium]